MNDNEFFRYIIVFALLLTVELFSGNLKPEKGQIKQDLTNISSYLNTGQELPYSNLMGKQKTKAIITFNTAAGFNGNSWYGNPGLWSGTNITKNLMVSAGLSRYSGAKQSARSFGSTLTYIANSDSTRKTGILYITAGLNFLEGPSYFDYKNYHLSLSRKFFMKEYKIIVGFSKHYNQVDLNNMDRNDQKTISNNYLKGGIFNRYKNIIYGVELNFWTNYLGMKLNLTCLIP